MDAKTIAVIEYFNGQRQCVMPPFQRSYVWDAVKWRQLWDDIVVHYSPEIDMDARHFLGAIVTLPLKTHPVGVNKHMIIDGQQRLTTISILLCAIREKLTEPSKKGLVEDYLINRHFDEGDRFKVVPTITNGDRDVFCRVIAGEQTPADASHQIVRAFRFYLQLLGTSDEDGIAFDAGRILQILQYSLQVVMVSLDDEHDDPYVIFESLNAKSEKLEESDLVRNFVLMKFRHTKSGVEQERIYSHYWQPLQDDLGGRLTEFLRHYSLYRRQGDLIKKRGVYIAIKTLLHGTSVLAIEEQLKELVTLAKYYQRFVYACVGRGVSAQTKL